MKKGFTLIELLGVIILIGIVTLFATPIVFNIIDDVKISVGHSEANIVYNAINTYCDQEKFKENINTNYKNKCTNELSMEDLKNIVNLGNLDLNKIEIEFKDNKVDWLKLESNGNLFGLNKNQMELGYERPNLINKLIDTNKMIKDNDIYYFKGSNVNNYLWYGGHHWQILELDEKNKTLKLISQQPLVSLYPDINVWTTKEEYEKSYINNWLNDYFYNNLPNKIKENIIYTNFNIGPSKNISEITTNQKVGLLDIKQYQKYGGNKSFLDIEEVWGLGNTYDKYIYLASYAGGISTDSLSNFSGVRPVITINDINVSSGTGTIYDNYIHEDNEIKSGDYVKIKYNGNDYACGSDNECLFRIIENNGNLKLIFNGMLPQKSKYGTDSLINLDSTIYNPLNNFKDNLDINLTKGKFYKGIYNWKSNYNFSDINHVYHNDYLENEIGLPVVGELFTGNDLDMGEHRIFIDNNLVENPYVSSFMWTMNRVNDESAIMIERSGYFDYNLTFADRGVRPVIYVSKYKVLSGSGTPKNPYILN